MRQSGDAPKQRIERHPWSEEKREAHLSAASMPSYGRLTYLGMEKPISPKQNNSVSQKDLESALPRESF